jgi:hypothetical protein
MQDLGVIKSDEFVISSALVLDKFKRVHTYLSPRWNVEQEFSSGLSTKDVPALLCSTVFVSGVRNKWKLSVTDTFPRRIGTGPGTLLRSQPF